MIEWSHTELSNLGLTQKRYFCWTFEYATSNEVPTQQPHHYSLCGAPDGDNDTPPHIIWKEQGVGGSE